MDVDRNLVAGNGVPKATKKGAGHGFWPKSFVSVTLEALIGWDRDAKAGEADLAMVDLALRDSAAKESPFVEGEEKMGFDRLGLGARGKDGIKNGCPLFVGPAVGLERAEGAFGRFGRTGASAKIHQPLVDGSWGVFLEHDLNKGFDLCPALFFSGWFPEREEAGDDPFSVSVDGSDGSIEGEGVNGSFCIGANSREGSKIFGILGDFSLMMLH
jgi:hypothetical protein